ncbi:MAG: response regulator, partial [Gammaproteobacteria bacterium]
MPIRVVAVDDHFLVRAGIRSILDGEGAISLVGEGECGADIHRLVQEHRPDVILLDLNIPATVPGNGGGDEPDVFMVFPAIARLRRDFPETKVIILSQYNT